MPNLSTNFCSLPQDWASGILATILDYSGFRSYPLVGRLDTSFFQLQLYGAAARLLQCLIPWGGRFITQHPGDLLISLVFEAYKQSHCHFNRKTLCSLVLCVSTSCSQPELCECGSLDLSLAVAESREDIGAALFKLIMLSLSIDTDGIIQHICQLFWRIICTMQLFNLRLILCCKNINIL